MAEEKPGTCGIPAPYSDQIPVGIVQEWNSIPFYISTPAVEPLGGVVLATDVFGWEIPQVRKIADLFAGHGLLAVLPDILEGEPLQSRAEFSEWILKHNPAQQSATLLKIAGHLKAQYHLKSVSVVGFCWGAKVAVEASKSGDVASVVVFHPSFVKVEDITEVKAPMAIFGAEIDRASPPELVEQFHDALRASEFASRALVAVIPGVHHGFACRYDPSDQVARKVAVDAHTAAAEFIVANSGL